MIDQHALDRLLEEQGFLRGLDSRLRTLILGCATLERFPAGRLICRQGEPATRCHLIRRGQVNLELPGLDGTTVLEILGDGEVLGWSWLVPPYRTTLDARAVTPVATIGLNADCLRQRMDQNDALAFALYKRFKPIMARRMAQSRQTLRGVLGPPV